MKILVSSYDNSYLASADVVEKGIYIDADPDNELYRLTTEGEYTYFFPEGLDIFEVDEVPAEVVPDRYCYTPKDGFYPNPNWVEPPKPIEMRLDEVEETTELNTECIDELGFIVSENAELNENVSECLDESAALIAELCERIEALEARLK